MSFQNVLFGFILPFFLFFLIIFSLLRRSQIFKEYTIEFGISLIISLLGSYWLYINKLSDILISSMGLIIFIIFVVLFLFSISVKTFNKIISLNKEMKKERMKENND